MEALYKKAKGADIWERSWGREVEQRTLKNIYVY